MASWQVDSPPPARPRRRRTDTVSLRTVVLVLALVVLVVVTLTVADAGHRTAASDDPPFCSQHYIVDTVQPGWYQSCNGSELVLVEPACIQLPSGKVRITHEDDSVEIAASCGTR